MENPGDTTRRDALVRSVCARLQDDRRTEDEIRVVDEVLAGVEFGADKHGPMNLADDDRDFDDEASQELRDLLAYLAMKKIAQQHRRLERLQCEMHDELSEEIAKDEALHGFLGVDGALRELRDSVPIAKPIIEFVMPEDD